MDELVKQYLQYQIILGKRKRTVAQYESSLKDFSSYLRKNCIFSFFTANPKDIKNYYLFLINSNYSLSVKNRKSYAVYSFYKWLQEKKMILINPAPLPITRKLTYPFRYLLTPQKMNYLFQELSLLVKLNQIRDFITIDLAYSCGLRRMELQQLNIEDINPDNGTVFVKGKGDKDRVVPIGKKTLANVFFYIYHIRSKILKNSKTQALLVTSHKGGKRINLYTINRIFAIIRKKYNLGVNFTPHALRHAFATDLVKNGAPIQDVSLMLGHEKLETTQIYTHLMPMDLKKQLQKYHPRS